MSWIESKQHPQYSFQPIYYYFSLCPALCSFPLYFVSCCTTFVLFTGVSHPHCSVIFSSLSYIMVLHLQPLPLCFPSAMISDSFISILFHGSAAFTVFRGTSSSVGSHDASPDALLRGASPIRHIPQDLPVLSPFGLSCDAYLTAALSDASFSSLFRSSTSLCGEP